MMRLDQIFGRGLFSTVVAGLTAGPGAAHPHVFIDTSVTAILDQNGQLTAIRLRWDYDDYVSMLLVEDKGADTDADGTISSAEMVALEGFDMVWNDGFDGDASLIQAEMLLPLKPGPLDWVTGWAVVEDGGHLWSQHTRKLVSPVDLAQGPVSIVVYDVTDYTAYALSVARLLPGDPAGAVPVDCRIGPSSEVAVDTGFLSTLGLFFFGSDDSATTGSVVPVAAPGRVVAVLSCN